MYNIFVLETGEQEPPCVTAEVVLKERRGFYDVVRSTIPQLFPGDRVKFNIQWGKHDDQD